MYVIVTSLLYIYIYIYRLCVCCVYVVCMLCHFETSRMDGPSGLQKWCLTVRGPKVSLYRNCKGLPYIAGHPSKLLQSISFPVQHNGQADTTRCPVSPHNAHLAVLPPLPLFAYVLGGLVYLKLGCPRPQMSSKRTWRSSKIRQHKKCCKVLLVVSDFECFS